MERPYGLVPNGIEPLCGWDWVSQHKHDLDNWIPKIELVTPTARYTISVKDKSALKEVMKTIRGKR